MSVLQKFLRQRPAGGERVSRKDGNRCRHCFQKEWHRVRNSYAAGARKHVEDCANVPELLCDRIKFALTCAMYHRKGCIFFNELVTPLYSECLKTYKKDTSFDILC